MFLWASVTKELPVHPIAVDDHLSDHTVWDGLYYRLRENGLKEQKRNPMGQEYCREKNTIRSTAPQNEEYV